MADKTATWTLNLEGNVESAAAALRGELLQTKVAIEESKAALKGMSESVKSLKGSTEEVAKAKGELNAKIDAERSKITAANIAALKQKHTLGEIEEKRRKDELARRKREAKAHTDELREIKEMISGQKKVGDGFKAAGGPLGELTGKLGEFRELAKGTNGTLALMALGVGTVVGAVAALTAGAAAAAIKLGTFVLTSANALRSMNIMREAVSGSAENAKNLGTQVDFMSRKVATSKIQLNELAVSLTKSLSGGVSRASGKAIVDTFAAVSQAAAAAGDDTGAALREIIERGKVVGRIWASPFELQGKGIQFGEIAKALADNLKIGIGKAREALFNGRVSLEAGAAALRTAVEAKFGKVNAEKLLDWDVQLDKVHERLVGLTKNVVLEPLLKGVASLLEKFDETSVTGKSIELMFTKVGEAITKISPDVIVGLTKTVEQLVLWGLEAVELFSKWGPRIEQVTRTLADNKAIMETLKFAGVSLLGVVGSVAAGIAIAGAAVAGTVAMMGLPFYALWKGYQLIKDIKWSALARGIVDGLVGGLKSGASWLMDSVKHLGELVKDAFKSALHIESPSKDFAQYGKMTVKGYQGGVEAEAPRAQGAVDRMAPGSPPGLSALAPSGGSGRAGGSIGMLQIHINLPEGMKTEPAHEAARALTQPSVLRELTRAVREALITQGVPTQAQGIP